jgi:hypothetical protein
MNDGMKIILERMKTHPEEFKDEDNSPFAYNGKWVGLVHKYENNLPEEDMKAFKEAVNVMRQEEFTAKVMEELLDPKEEQLELNLKWNTSPSVGATLASSLEESRPWITAAGLTTNSNSLTLGNTTINESHLEHLKAHVDAMKREVDNQKQKPHKTIFGKLFNYT